MRFGLRTLLILLAIGPPLFAAAWINRDYLLEHRPGTGFYVPADSARVEAYWRKRLVPVQKLNTISGMGVAALFPVAVLLQWAVFRGWRNWSRPPKQSPLFWAAFAAALLMGMFFLVFVLTLPSVWEVPHPEAYRRWKPL